MGPGADKARLKPRPPGAADSFPFADDAPFPEQIGLYVEVIDPAHIAR